MCRRCLLPSTSRNVMSHELEKRKSNTPCDTKTIPSLNGPDQKLKWSTITQEYLKNLDLRDTDKGATDNWN